MIKNLGDYEIVEEIGSGAQSTVYLARHKTLDIPIVLKVLRAEMAEDRMFVDRFEREARTMAKMPHENIVRVTDYRQVDGQYYIAMEYVEGTDLRKWMKENGALPVEIAILMLRDICSGLKVAHQASPPVVHRDIKPANMMFSRAGVIKIMDFGLARAGTQSVELTVADELIGTPAYMSPEQADRRNRELDARSDIFSTGILAYELLAGRRPFTGKGREEVLEAIRTRQPHWLGHVNPEIPDEAVRLVHRMLDKDLLTRPSDIGEIHGELEDLVERLELQRRKNWLKDYYEKPSEIEESLHPKRISRHLVAGIELERLGAERFENALWEFRTVLQLDPGNAEAQSHILGLEQRHLALGAAHVREGPESFDDALRELRRVLFLNPEHVEARRLVAELHGRHLALGLAQLEQGQLDEAETELSRVRSIAPQDAAAIAGLADVEQRRKVGSQKPPDLKPPPLEDSPAEERPAVDAPVPERVPVPGPERPRGARRIVLLGTGLVGLALVSALVIRWWLAREAVLIVAVSPATAALRVDGQARELATDGAIRGLTIGEHTLSAVLDRYETETRVVRLGRGQTVREVLTLRPIPVPPPPPPPPPPSPPPPPPDSTATLIVTTVPLEARVLVDRQLVARDSAGGVFGLKPGPRRIRVEYDGYIPQSRSVTLAKGPNPGLHFSLAIRDTTPGVIFIQVTPAFEYVTFSVDGEVKASGHPSAHVTVPPGRHHVTVKAAHQAREWPVEVIARDTLRLSHTFRTGCLLVRSKGEWANVILENQNKGWLTGNVICELLAGADYRVRVERKNYRVREGEARVTIVKGDTVEVEYTVERRR